MQKILIVDDDSNISELISLYLTKEFFDCRTADDGEAALAAFREYNPDLILLDLMLPGIDGYQVCRTVRESSKVPIIMMSAKGEVFDKVLGLELGADDYIIKPFDTKELIARIKAVLRRTNAEPAKEPETQQVVTFPGLVINKTNYSVQLDGKPVQLTPRELDLLYCLALSPGQVFTREVLLDKLWGYDYIGDSRTVDVHVKRIREKLGEHDGWTISTIWGVGYKFEVK